MLPRMFPGCIMMAKAKSAVFVVFAIRASGRRVCDSAHCLHPSCRREGGRQEG